MKPAITLLVHSRSGSASALAEVGRQRALDLGLAVTVISLRTPDPLLANPATESVTALVPVDFAAAQHEAWCLLCQLSLLRREVGFSILVLGTESDAAFQARQRALLVRSPVTRRKRAA
jgi:hypothetical protein